MQQIHNLLNPRPRDVHQASEFCLPDRGRSLCVSNLVPLNFAKLLPQVGSKVGQGHVRQPALLLQAPQPLHARPACKILRLEGLKGREKNWHIQGEDVFRESWEHGWANCSIVDYAGPSLGHICLNDHCHDSRLRSRRQIGPGFGQSRQIRIKCVGFCATLAANPGISRRNPRLFESCPRHLTQVNEPIRTRV